MPMQRSRLPAVEGDIVGGCVAAAQTVNGCGEILLLQLFGAGYGPEEPFGRELMFGGRDLCEVPVLTRLEMFAAAAGLQIGRDFVPRRAGVLRRQEGLPVVEPDEHPDRCDEQQQDQQQTYFHCRRILSKEECMKRCIFCASGRKSWSENGFSECGFGFHESISNFANLTVAAV